MKRLHILTLLFSAFAFLTAGAALKSDFYKARSVLADGKWVKIGVDRTGVYEISYSDLRNMGFENPAKVAVYGKGGRVLPEDFTTNAGTPTLTDDLSPVKVIHENEKIYFYGLGPEEIQFVSNSGYSTGGYFQRKSRNIYSTRGYYFLTDSQAPELMQTKSDLNPSLTLDKGVSFCYHELDSVQNNTNSGQLFWGEHIGEPKLKERTWSIEMPDAIAGKGVMECVLYITRVEQEWLDDRDQIVSYGIKEGDSNVVTNFSETSKTYYRPVNPTVSEIGIPGNKGTVFAGWDYVEITHFSNVDYWVVSYDRSIPTMKGINGESVSQQLMALPAIKSNVTGSFTLSNCASYKVLDVTTPSSPSVLTVNRSGANGTVNVRNTGAVPQVVVFDTQMPQYQISGFESVYSPVATQNLHALKSEGADFIIITSPEWRHIADQIADLHREYDGIKVAVATTEECYNEFSGGVPDPMAYRSFAKMLYMSPTKPKNILLLGQLYGDFRGLQFERNPFNGIIAYQSTEISTARGAHNINDFYGMMDDILRTDYVERNNVQIGVAILPIHFESEGQIIVNKIRDYLERTDFAYYLGKYTAVGGIGDNHTHDTQVKDIDTFVRNLTNTGTIFTPLSIDTYGNKEAQKKLINQFNEGTSWFTYFGHGAEQFLGKDRYFFSAGDVFKLRNTMLPFAGFGGCQITNSDRGVRGLGETIVTATPYGCIGSLVSARETWSGQNMEFFKQFFTCLFTEGAYNTSPKRSTPVTIGEVYAGVKNYSYYSNELAYQLICDPALVIPAINRTITVDGNATPIVPVPGEDLELKGYVMTADNQTDTKFNGEIVVRLNEPTANIACGKIESGENPGSLQFPYRDAQISMAVAEVKDGVFNVRIHLPAECSAFSGEYANLFLTAYDPSTRTGAGKGYTMKIQDPSPDGSTESKDLTPPSIEHFSFDAGESCINISVSDNVALNLSNNPLTKGLYLYIDGKERSEAHFTLPVLETGRPAYSKKIAIGDLAYGEHSAALKVKDAAGNISLKEITFTYNPFQAIYTIRLSDESNAQKSVIVADDNIPSSATLHIISSSGETVWTGAFKGGKAEWRHVDSNGVKVKPGHYKGFIIETGEGHSKGHSDTIDIPVV